MSLSELQEKVVKSFGSNGDEIDIVVLYNRIYGDPERMTVREMYQKLGPLFARTNNALRNDGQGLVITTGTIFKRSYKLTRHQW